MKIVVFAPFGAGIGQHPGRTAQLTDDLARAATVFGENCVLEISRELAAGGRLAIPLLPPDGLQPQTWLQREPQLRALAEARVFLQGAEESALRAAEVAGELRKRWPALPGDWQRLGCGEKTSPATDSLGGLLDLVDLPGGGDQSHVQRQGATVWREEVETRLAAILDAVVTQPAYRQRVAAWQGLSWLHEVAGGEVDFFLIDSDQQSLAEVVRQHEKELIDREPDLLLVDFPLERTPLDQGALAALTGLADRLLAPVLSWFGPAFFGISSWRELAQLAYLQNHLEKPAYGQWRSLRSKAEGRWLTACVGRFAQKSRGSDDNPLDDPADKVPPVWLAPIWALAAVSVRQYRQTGFASPVTGQAISGPMAGALMLEVPFSEDRHFQLIRSGLAPLFHPAADQVGFAAVPQAGGGSLDQQLYLHQILAWLFAAQKQNPLPNGEELAADLAACYRRAGLDSPEPISIAVTKGHLILQLMPPVELVSAAEPVSLQLPWE